MATLRIDALGELAVFRDGKLLRLPASKRARALLAYLALTARPHRRDRLCEVFWEIPDDPRGALRWALSKLRSVVNEEGTDRLVADRERDRLAQVSVPTLVIHSLGDRRIPVTTGRDIAAAIPNAEFLGLESDGHLLLGREPASQTFVDAVRNFVERT